MKKLLSILLITLLFIGTAFADTPEQTVPDASNAPAIPAGTLSASLVTFTSNQTYAVYSAPDRKSIRGAKGRARVSTNGWIQVFGSDGDWILVQYDITDKHNRIGYIYIIILCSAQQLWTALINSGMCGIPAVLLRRSAMSFAVSIIFQLFRIRRTKPFPMTNGRAINPT